MTATSADPFSQRHHFLEGAGSGAPAPYPPTRRWRKTIQAKAPVPDSARGLRSESQEIATAINATLRIQAITKFTPILFYGEDDSLLYYLFFFATNPAITATAISGVEKKNVNTPFTTAPYT